MSYTSVTWSYILSMTIHFLYLGPILLRQICSWGLRMKTCVFILFLFFQKRTKEKLVHVLSLCGQEVGLSKNPSVSSVMYHGHLAIVLLLPFVCSDTDLEDSNVNDESDSHHRHLAHGTPPHCMNRHPFRDKEGFQCSRLRSDLYLFV